MCGSYGSYGSCEASGRDSPLRAVVSQGYLLHVCGSYRGTFGVVHTQVYIQKS